MICKKCGTRVDMGVFCPKCGGELSNEMHSSIVANNNSIKFKRLGIISSIFLIISMFLPFYKMSLDTLKTLQLYTYGDAWEGTLDLASKVTEKVGYFSVNSMVGNMSSLLIPISVVILVFAMFLIWKRKKIGLLVEFIGSYPLLMVFAIHVSGAATMYTKSWGFYVAVLGYILLMICIFIKIKEKKVMTNESI